MAVKAQTGKDFPTSAYEQLWGAICAVFDSWMNERAILYRKMEGIPAEWGTAVSVQAMVFGNMGDTSATGVCFSRDAGNGEDLFNGEYLINAQGEERGGWYPYAATDYQDRFAALGETCRYFRRRTHN